MSEPIERIVFTMTETGFAGNDGAGGDVAVSEKFAQVIALGGLTALLEFKKGCGCSGCGLLRVAHSVLKDALGATGGVKVGPAIDKSKLC